MHMSIRTYVVYWHSYAVTGYEHARADTNASAAVTTRPTPIAVAVQAAVDPMFVSPQHTSVIVICRSSSMITTPSSSSFLPASAESSLPAASVTRSFLLPHWNSPLLVTAYLYYVAVSCFVPSPNACQKSLSRLEPGFDGSAATFRKGRTTRRPPRCARPHGSPAPAAQTRPTHRPGLKLALRAPSRTQRRPPAPARPHQSRRAGGMGDWRRRARAAWAGASGGRRFCM